MNMQGQLNRRLFLAVFAMAVTAVGLGGAARADSASGTYTDTVEKTLAFNEGASFTLHGRNGSVKINAWDEDELNIVGEKRMEIEGFTSWISRFIGLKAPKIESKEEAQEYLEKFKMEVTGDADGIDVKTVRPESASNLQFRMDYTISIPRRAEVWVELVNGGITIKGVTGSVEGRTVNGGVYFEDIAGPVTVRTTNGSIDLERIVGSVEARTVNGRLEVELASFSDGGGDISCRTTNGSIRLGVPEDSGFDLHVKSRTSRFRNDFTFSSTLKEDPREIEGIVGEGGPLISIKTTNGRVELEAI